MTQRNDNERMNKTALQDYIIENEHLKACLKADNDIQNRIIKLSEPFINIQNGKTYCAYHALDVVERIVKAYADLPEKIEGMKWKEPGTRVMLDEKYHYTARRVNKTIDDILNMFKEIPR